MTPQTPDRSPETPELTQHSLRRHIPVLDGIRGLAILLVLFHHGGDMAASGLVDELVLWGLHSGARGVDLFFVLSGFLITGIIADTRGRKGFFTSFYARRVLRIFPVYYALVFLSFYILPNLGAFLVELPGVSQANADMVQTKLDRFGSVSEYEVHFWLFFSNFVFAELNAWGHGILAVSWSLAIEEQFYLLWPFLFFVLDARRMKWVCLLLLVGSPLFRIGLLLHGSDPFYGGDLSRIDLNVLTFGRLEGLALGALLALHLRGGTAELDPEHRLRRLVRPAQIAAVVGVVVAVLSDLPFHLAVDPDVKSRLGLMLGWFGYTFAAVGLAGVVVLAIAAKPGSFWYAFWTSRVMCSFGKYSYAIYLTHLPIRALIRDLVYGPNFNGSRFGTAFLQFPTLFGSELPGQILFYVLAIPACWFAGWLSWNLLEKHVLKLKKYFPYGRTGGTPPSAAGS